VKKIFSKKDDMNDNTKIALTSLLVAIFIVNNRFLDPSPFWQANISLAIVTVIIAAFVMGPKWAAIVGGLGDMIGALVFPRGGPFFFEFTLSWILIGIIFGIFLYRKRNTSNARLLVNLIISSLLVYILIQMGLTTLWLYLRFDAAWIALVAIRSWLFAILLVSQIVISLPLLIFLRKPIDKFLLTDDDMEEEVPAID